MLSHLFIAVSQFYRRGYSTSLRVTDHVIRNNTGAALVEFAIVANVIIVINFLVFDFASYSRLSEQTKHATQFVQSVLMNDADHQISDADLVQKIKYFEVVTGQKAVSQGQALVVMDVMPYLASTSSNWSFIVCWSWSSNPAVMPAPKKGTPLPVQSYNLASWAPSSGSSASAAILIVESHMRFQPLFPASIMPKTISNRGLGPVRYVSNMPLNLLYYGSGKTALNDTTITETGPSKPVLCLR